MTSIERKILPLFYINILFLFFVASGMCQESSPPEDKQNSYEQNTKMTDNDILSISEKVLSGLSDEERQWYKRFQDGILFFDGWNEISQEIIKSFPGYNEVEKKALIQRLGVKIGTEWCKENNQRRIDTTMLKEWGDKIRAAVRSGPDDIHEVLVKIENEVDLIIESDTEITFVSPQS